MLAFLYTQIAYIKKPMFPHTQKYGVFPEREKNKFEKKLMYS